MYVKKYPDDKLLVVPKVDYHPFGDMWASVLPLLLVGAVFFLSLGGLLLLM